MKNASWLIFLGIAILVFIVVRKIMSKFKVPKIGSVALFTGGVKAGKSTCAFYFAMKQYKRALRSWRFRNFFLRAFGKELEEKPLFYSNVPVGIPYVPVTRDMLLRKVRFREYSVVYFNEASLLADSTLFKDDELNERLNLFYKLFGHETGGYLVLDTHCVADNHFAVKRCTSQYFYVHHLVKWIPFFLIAYVREDRYSDDGTMVGVNDKDVEDSLKKVIIPRSIWKKIDSRCFSSLTDDLPCAADVVDVEKGDSLKVKKLVSFREYKSIPSKFKEIKKELKK